MSRTRWLHLTDIHAGMRAQGWLWPTFENEFLDDLARIHDQSGPWDFILFSGDLARAGLTSEFDVFAKVIEKVLAKASGLGSTCKVITVPGNHDLSRPSTINPNYLAIKDFVSNEELQQDFWGKDESGTRAFVRSCFDNYSKWRDQLVDLGLHERPVTEGYIPGDAGYVIQGASSEVRICALNSTWMQLTEGPYEGRLVVDPRQLISITEDDPDGWAAKSPFSLLVTHQPSDWLSANFKDLWYSDVYLPDRFDVHAFGHMHRPSNRSYSYGGGGSYRELQGSSLFGFERSGDGWERIQGYAVYELTLGGDDRVIRCWPRRLQRMQNGQQKIKPDQSYDLEDNNQSYSTAYRRSIQGYVVSTSTKEKVDPFVSESIALRFKISNIEVGIATDAAHASTRMDEQQRAESAWLEDARAFWLSSDWGLGAKPFIANLRDRFGGKDRRVFKLDASGFTTRENFLDDLIKIHGATFAEICDEIEKVGSSILVFEDASTPLLDGRVDSSAAAGLEEIVFMTKDYLPSGLFVITTKGNPVGCTLPIIELKPFDEPDTRTYIAAKIGPDGGVASASYVEKLFKLTEGSPSRLDTALRQLKVVSLNELALTDSDLAAGSSSVSMVPSALSDVIEALYTGSDDEKTAALLLGVLATFPAGEKLNVIKKLIPGKWFTALHATMLLDRNLIDAANFRRMGDASNLDEERLLTVPKLVREVIRARQSDAENLRNEQGALELYFGEKWRSGLSLSAHASQISRDPLASPYELQNANTILIRAILRGLTNKSDLDIEGAIRVTIAFCGRQLSGGHYRNALALCDEALPLIEADFPTQAVYLRLDRGRCYRMLGRAAEARDQYQATDLTGLSRALRQEAKLGLAMSQKAAGDVDQAKVAASEALAINAKSVTAHHARIFLAQLKAPSRARTKELIDLKNKAAARKWHTLENNIQMFLARNQPTRQKQITLRQVVDSSHKHKDFYNKFRAIIDMMEAREAGSLVLMQDRIALINAYQFFHAERLGDFFAKVHAILWSIFEEEGDIQNLLSLFRHSSFIWRLSGNHAAERVYLDALREKLDQIKRSNLAGIGKDRIYFLIRIQASSD